jgi:GNAT superfamily N-acetyltransferase
VLRIAKIDIPRCVINSRIRDLAEQAKSGRSQEFVAEIDGSEAGFLSYEDWSDQSLGFIYEIFVLPEFRGQGIGRDLLSYSEELAKSLRCTSIWLEPYAFDHEVDPECLISWYSRKGYVPKTGDPKKMEKSLVATQG